MFSCIIPPLKSFFITKQKEEIRHCYVLIVGTLVAQPLTSPCHASRPSDDGYLSRNGKLKAAFVIVE